MYLFNWSWRSFGPQVPPSGHWNSGGSNFCIQNQYKGDCEV